MNLSLLARGVGAAFVAGALTYVSLYSYFTQPSEDQLKISEANLLFALGLMGGIGYSINEVRNIVRESELERNYIPWAERVRNMENRERGR